MKSKTLFSDLNSISLYRGDLLRRIFFTLIVLIFYRLGTYIPIPGINLEIVKDLFFQDSHGIFGVFNLFSGGALARMTILALNVMPYIVASIVMQLVSVAIKGMDKVKSNEGIGHKSMNFYIRCMTIVFCAFQAMTMLIGLEKLGDNVVIEPGIIFRLTGVFSMVGGTMLLIWLGEIITAYGIGNGISLIIFTGIISELHNGLSHLLKLNKAGVSALVVLFVFLLFLLLLILIIYVEYSYRKVNIHYPKKQFNKVNRNNFSYIPLKINLSGVIPTIFANAMLLTPITVANFYKGSVFSDFILHYLSPGKVLYITFYLILIVFFNFFYTNFIFNPQENANFLKKGGGFIPGIRPGKHTSEYLHGIVFKLTFIGSAYLAVICIVPEIVRYYYNVPFIFSGTSLLIIVNVITETISQVQSYIFANKYDNLIKKYESKSGRLK
ncbi:preprotein translocase subunit SecY [Wolbachia endosymbiont of Pentidionis agamae]|uniref:preprotein translocase subunit SecY n=1 Tax=Wolbachia endosymbiont of Pentidionis agamae TaxID=3110435 RepID=UPI002FD1EAA2